MTEDTAGTRQRGTEALGVMSLGCILNCVATALPSLGGWGCFRGLAEVLRVSQVSSGALPRTPWTEAQGLLGYGRVSVRDRAGLQL